MRARLYIFFAVGVTAAGGACAPRAAGPKPGAVAARPQLAPSSAAPVYRFVPNMGGMRAQQIDPEHFALSSRGGRMVVGSDGSVEREAVPLGLMGGAPVPEHLGGGFVFWTSDGVYRARTFTGALEPIARIPGNAIGVEFGPSSLLLFTSEAPPHAYGLEPGRPVPLSPHGALEIATADAARALAFDAAGRALATIDGGRSWRDVTATLGETAGGIKQENHEVGFVLAGGVGAWLQKDGGFVRRPIVVAHGRSPQMKALDKLTRAVAGGLPLSRTHALTVGEGGIEDLDLLSGQATVLAPKVPYGSSCLPVSLEEEGLLGCFSYAAHPSIAVVSHALSEHPEVEKVFQLGSDFSDSPFAVSDAELVVNASCSGQKVEGVACIRSPGRTGNSASGQRSEPARWVEVNIQAALGSTWQVLKWVPKAKGGVAAIALERAARTPPRVALIDATSGAVTPFDLPFRGVAPDGFGGAARNWVVLEDGTLRGFTATSALSVDAKGHVSPPTRTFRIVLGAGAFALAEDVASQLWQTKDHGEHWVEVARPPFEPEGPFVPAGAHIVANPRSMSCSLVGCVMQHESGLGTWLRLGWPDDRPRPLGAHRNARAAPSQPEPALVVPEPRPLPPRPKLRCNAASGAPSKPGRPLLTLGAPKKATTKPAIAKPATKKRETATGSADIPYRDVYLQDTSVTYSTRGVGRVRRTEEFGVLELLAKTRAPFQVEVIEPFEPAGRTLRATGSLGAWTGLLKAPGQGEHERASVFDIYGGTARPVLGTGAGRADGVLFVNRDFSFWVSHTGKIRPVRPGCRADSGYADARGALYVACGVDNGATALVDVEHDRTVFRVPLTERFRGDSGPGMSFFAPGEQLLTNTDAAAVGPDGKLAILRTASGSEPPTVDLPAWLLTADAPPVELAPWASLEPATSPACVKGEGYRALIQTLPSWIDVEGARASSNEVGMNAIVRWSPERVCLEAIEIPVHSSPPISMSLVARLTGTGANSAFVGTSTTESAREAATCELVAQ